MRIISGEFRSRRILSPPEDAPTRPIPDRVKESVFSILRGHCEGAEVFDVFSGTGSIGLEALSRGASRCVFVEKDREVAAALKENIETLGCADRAEVFIGDGLGPGALSRCPRPAHLIFLDPPYAMMEREAQRRRVLDQATRLAQSLDDTGYLVLRTPWPLVERLERVDCGESEDEEGRIAAAEESPVWRAKGATISLAIEGAVGPETHEYAGMAVHLFMKSRSDASGASGGADNSPS